ncbi:hypothetical protein H6P81_003995 [Aristolochia fimbriata]|uniref:Kri1-like C-terminal domain-containing protein n=1 Tax=Aristolochia fimbriata TaxID=158543 RepID=A0AAV7FE59_ARIFI|nr:hypothetical protein H6P81_003995 [Aristolochia fimbriata]
MGLNLFEGSDDEEDISNIEINKEFARRFEHNKKREDLQRFEELRKKGRIPDSEESSEESDEEEDLAKKDLQFYEALVRVKKNDPIINQKDVRFFDSDEEDEKSEETDENKQRKKKEKPMYLKDVMAKQLIEDGPEFSENLPKTHIKSYAEEQEEVRKAFLDAAQEAFNVDEGDLLTVKKSVDDNKEDDGEAQRRLEEYFGDDGELNENEMFLKNYLSKQLWIDKDKGQKPSPLDLGEISEEEEELDREDEYEAKYNFRYEEGAGDRILGHARNPEGSVRIKSNARKSQRQRKEERENQKKMEMEQELKHLKNLKMKEILDKLNKIRAVAGIKDGEACALDQDDLEEDFDPEEYDKKMKETFDADYYEAEDADPGFGSDDDIGDIGKPDFDKEDELFGLPKGWDEPGSRDGFLAVREKVLKRKKNNHSELSQRVAAEEGDGEDAEEDDAEDDEGDGEDVEEDNAEDDEEDDAEDNEEDDAKDNEEDEDDELREGEEEDDREEDEEKVFLERGKRKRKRKISLREKIAVEKDLEEYYKLDYEDTIGDLKTRFKYAAVPTNRYGLTSEEILVMDDKDLNQYVSLKKLAPYTPTEWKVSKQKRYHLKKNKKSFIQDVHLEGQNDNKKKQKKTLHDEEEKVQIEKSNDESGTSRRSKRRRRQAELKLTHSRLIAYGKLPPKAKQHKKSSA